VKAGILAHSKLLSIGKNLPRRSEIHENSVTRTVYFAADKTPYSFQRIHRERPGAEDVGHQFLLFQRRDEP
jgi:hypothetical protein